MYESHIPPIIQPTPIPAQPKEQDLDDFIFAQDGAPVSERYSRGRLTQAKPVLLAWYVGSCTEGKPRSVKKTCRGQVFSRSPACQQAGGRFG